MDRCEKFWMDCLTPPLKGKDGWWGWQAKCKLRFSRAAHAKGRGTLVCSKNRWTQRRLKRWASVRQTPQSSGGHGRGVGHCPVGKGSNERIVSGGWMGLCFKRFSLALLKNRLAGFCGGRGWGETHRWTDLPKSGGWINRNCCWTLWGGGAEVEMIPYLLAFN